MNKKYLLIPIVALVVIVAGVAMTRNSKSSMQPNTGSNSAAVAAEPNTVVIKNLDFVTKKITVKKGTAITWKNQDTARHTVTFEDPTLASASSELFAPGESFTYTFTTAGTYTYHCMPHPFMKAVVQVTE
jgi:plastocyanin